MAAEPRPRSLAPLRCGLAGLGLSAAALLLLELLVGRRLVEQRQRTLASELTAKIVLAELALERLTPASLAELSGLRLAVGAEPDGSPALSPPEAFPAVPAERGGTSGQKSSAGRGLRHAAPPALAPQAAVDPLLRRQAADLRVRLCQRLGRCPPVQPALGAPRGVWVAMASPLEAVWLFVPLPPLPGWPPDPLLLALALGIGGLGAGLLYLDQEVRRPLGRLGQALEGVGLEPEASAVLRPEGSAAVRRLTHRFNAMVDRLGRSGRERATMLAGIAHDLRSPLTRLRLRLDLAPASGLPAADCRRGLADLAALERITRQFLHYAGQDRGEPPLPVALDALLSELAALADPAPLQLALEPLQRRVRPITLSRAIANLIDNALAHGAPPLRLELRADGPDGFRITVWDQGPGLAEEAWSRALEPFQRLDPSRSGQGHCGLGLAIAERIARDHGGGLEACRGPHGFGVALRGRSLSGG